ncbi:NAD(P)/FAD-dependent oxidoreductase [Mycobacterium sp. CVI_P3]|uniref:Pyridine nucleotide-disulfide oxidoreductase domain-containing protein 2 n=1 Tax=Mycobacterium pinniadriaticum TaxID=2994102 RepID=A0ABT3S9R1_9MYCO|nr:NAD(P)/FAD-dependent oxidoreductase [Mycobacterium pinniadriaticum]MCX2930092.1 NAD(P)/FAD-dependent oxidoreductase [Mycobacterium pinniadriaticum]MCX2936259.1 NAD(P)/FAD-dependent oxidoreductase [Mycobacterium pinniadriaticum]
MKSPELDANYDYIVIGGGHNGLSAACTLAASGATVLVLEQRPHLGGLANSGAFCPEAPHHILSLGAMDDMFMSCTSFISDLDLPKYGYRGTPVEAPYGWIGEDGSTLLLFHDMDRTLAEVRRFSAADARSYADLQPALSWIFEALSTVMPHHPAQLPKAELGKLILKLAPSRAIRRQLGRIMSHNLVDLMADTFQSDQMRSLTTYWGSMIGPIDHDGGGFYCVGLAAVHLKPGVIRPLGGMGAVMTAMATYAAERGAQIRTETAVARVIVERNRATGVELADGTEIGATQGVLAAVPPQLAYGGLLDDGVLDSATRAKVAILPASGNNSATFKIDIALSGRACYPRGAKQRAKIDGFDIRKTALMTGTFDENIRQLAAIRAGETLPKPPVYMAVLSANDSGLAPQGQDVVYLAANVPAQPRDGWEKAKGVISAAIMESVASHLDGFDAEIGRIETSPADFGTQFATPNGSYFHVDMTPLRLAMNRPAPGLGGYRSPVTNYFHAGAGSHPGGGVSGWPGRLAAQTALGQYD